MAHEADGEVFCFSGSFHHLRVRSRVSCPSTSVSIKVVKRERDRPTVEVTAVDYPRLLILEL
ncbi:MAG: hypothetical protein ACK40X_00360 [Armatimonadota bacterium]